MDENWNAWPQDDEDSRRKAEIEEMMRSQRERYFRDEAVQQEYRDIVDRQMAAQQADDEAMVSPIASPEAFDEALSRFKQTGKFFPDDREERADADAPLALVGAGETEAKPIEQRKEILPDASVETTRPNIELAAGARFLKFRPPVRGPLPPLPKRNVTPGELPSTKLTSPEITAGSPTFPKLRNALARLERDDASPSFDRSVKWGDVKSVDDLPAYTRDIAGKLSQTNPKSGLPRFLFRLEPLQRQMVDKIGAIYGDLARTAERSLEISSFVVEKLYAKGKEIGDKALAGLPDLLEKGEVYASKPREGGQRRIAVVGPWGNTGDKLVAVLELGESGKSAEVVTVHPMQKSIFENRLRKAGALSIGTAALLSLDDDDDDDSK